MTLDELQERIKAEIILHEGDVAQYQWRQLGLLQEATGVGLSESGFFSLVNQVSLNVQSDFGRITDLRQSILTRLNQRRGKLTPADIDTLATEAERARLSRSFVVDTWIPNLLGQLSFPDPTPVPTRLEPTPDLILPEPSQPVRRETAEISAETTESMRRKVTDSLNDYGDFIPAPAIRSLFRTISYDEAELSVAIWNYLQINQYRAVTEPLDGSLRDKLTSTDWRVSSPEPVRALKSPQPDPTSEPVYVPPVLSEPTPPIVRSFTATPARVKRGQPVTLEWEVENLLAVTIDDLGEGLSPKNRGWIKPKKTADYTLFDVNNNPLSTVKVEVIQPDRSGLYGVLFALALLLLIYWFVRGSASGGRRNADRQSTEQKQTKTQSEPTSQNTPLSYNGPESPVATSHEPTAEISTEPTPEPAESVATDTKPVEKAIETAAVPQKRPEPEPAPITPADARRGKYEETFGDKPYDKLELGDDERGWRRARTKGRWGYIDQNDKWVINPEYEAITPFKGNTAAAFLNGQLITIDRTGQQVRN